MNLFNTQEDFRHEYISLRTANRQNHQNIVQLLAAFQCGVQELSVQVEYFNFCFL